MLSLFIKNMVELVRGAGVWSCLILSVQTYAVAHVGVIFGKNGIVRLLIIIYA